MMNKLSKFFGMGGHNCREVIDKVTELIDGELEETARSIRSLVDTLERHPQALIFGKDVKVEEERTCEIVIIHH